jgi:hypothetical protein
MARPMSVRHCRNSGYASRLQQLRPFRIDRCGEKRWVTRLRTNVYGEWHQTATTRARYFREIFETIAAANNLDC